MINLLSKFSDLDSQEKTLIILFAGVVGLWLLVA